MAVIAYLRRSKEDSSGLSLPAQLAAIEDRFGEPDLVFEDDGLSGGLRPEKRPGLLRALDSLKKGDVLAARDRARLGRSVEVTVLVEMAVRDKGASVQVVEERHTNGSDPEAVFMRRQHDSMNEYQRLRIGLHTRAALARKRERGEKLGGAHLPYGYRLNGDGRTLVEAEDEQEVIAKCVRWQKGKRSLRWMARRLDQLDIPARSGGWHPQKLSRILQRQPA